MKAALSSLLVLLVFTAAARAAAIPIVTDENFPPLTYVDNGKPTGIDVDMMAEAARRTGLNIRFEPMPWRRALMELQRGTVPMGMPLFRTAEREAYATFVAPVHFSNLGAFVVKGKAFPFDSIGDLRGKRLGLMRGWAITDELDHAIADGRLQAEEASTIDQNLHKLMLGRIDVFVSNVFSVRYVMKGTPMAQQIELLPHLLQTDRPAYLAISKNANQPDEAALIASLRAALTTLHKDGTYSKIVAHYTQ